MMGYPYKAHLSGLYHVELQLDLSSSHARQDVRPAVRGTSLCHVSGLEILRYLVHKYAKAEGLSDDFCPSKWQVC